MFKSDFLTSGDEMDTDVDEAHVKSENLFPIVNVSFFQNSFSGNQLDYKCKSRRDVFWWKAHEIFPPDFHPFHFRYLNLTSQKRNITVQENL